MGLRCSTIIRNIPKHQFTPFGFRSKHRGSFMAQHENTSGTQSTPEQTSDTVYNANEPNTIPENDALEVSTPDTQHLEQQFSNPTEDPSPVSVDIDQDQNQEYPQPSMTFHQTNFCIWETTTVQTTQQCEGESMSWVYIQSTVQELETNPQQEDPNGQFNIIIQNTEMQSYIQQAVDNPCMNECQQWNASLSEMLPFPFQIQEEEQPIAASLQQMERQLLANYDNIEDQARQSPPRSGFSEYLEPASPSLYGCIGEPYVSIYSRQNDDIVSRSIQEMDRKFDLDQFNTHASIYDDPQPSTSRKPDDRPTSDDDYSKYFECFHLDKQQCFSNFNNSAAVQVPEDPDFDSMAVIEQSMNDVVTPRTPKEDMSSFSGPNRRKLKRKPMALMCPLLFQSYFNVKVHDVEDVDISFAEIVEGFQPVVSDNFPPAIAVTNKLLIIGRGPHNHLDLDSFGHCNFVSDLHAMVFYDEFSNIFKLFNRSPYGTQINDVIYGNEQEREATTGKRGPHETELGHGEGCLCIHREVPKSPEQTIVLEHGATVSFGCIAFVFSVLKDTT